MTAKYREKLPIIGAPKNSVFLTDGGLETVLIFENGLDLPEFASFPLLKTEEGRITLKNYAEEYVDFANEVGAAGFILETPTWRANADWAKKLGYSETDLVKVIKFSVKEGLKLREAKEKTATPIVISGMMGPRGDGYVVENAMTPKEAADYHGLTIDAFAEAGADQVTMATVNYVDEAVGASNAAAKAKIPIVIGFTVETDGKLPSGMSLAEAIKNVETEAEKAPAYYLVNCAHPTHFWKLFEGDSKSEYFNRILGVRCNPSKMSHTELDSAPELDAGNPEEFGLDHAKLRSLCPQMRHFGACCGSNLVHIKAIWNALK